MRIFKKALTLSDIILSRVIYVLSFLMPRDKKLWIFIGWLHGGEREIFGENPKYLFLHTSNNRPNLNSVWIGRDKKICKILKDRGYKCRYINSPAGIYYSLRAGYTFVGAFMQIANWRYSGGSRVVQLWHGKGPKKTGHANPYGLQRYNRILYPNLFKKFYMFISASDYLAKFVVSAFKTQMDKVLVAGFPKYDVFFSNTEGSDVDINEGLQREIEYAKSKKVEKVFLYAPTFRPGGSNPLDELRLGELNNLLRKKNYLLIGTLHPKFASKEWLPKQSFTNIKFTEAGYDIYPLLPKFDELITDYSSLAMDFIILDKPIIFFVPDIGEYKKTPGLHEELWSLMPGHKVYSFEELKGALDKEDEYKEERKRAREILFKFKDGNSSKRIVERLGF